MDIFEPREQLYRDVPRLGELMSTQDPVVVTENLDVTPGRQLSIPGQKTVQRARTSLVLTPFTVGDHSGCHCTVQETARTLRMHALSARSGECNTPPLSTPSSGQCPVFWSTFPRAFRASRGMTARRGCGVELHSVMDFRTPTQCPS
jgi:hypothetical protein